MNCVKVISVCRVNLTERFLINRKLLQCWKIKCFYSTFELNKNYNVVDDDILLRKIIYNEVLIDEKPKVTPKLCESLCLKYLKEDFVKNAEIEEKEIVHFPYEIVDNTSQQTEQNIPDDKFLIDAVRSFTPSDEKIEIPNWNSFQKKIKCPDIERPNRWFYNDETDIEIIETLKFGSYNPKKPVSNVPCGGCGALLHCTDPTLPGFILAEIFESKRVSELSEEMCQRCKFLRDFDIALGVNVSPLEYVQLISEIKEKNALIIIMVDMLDFPCSIFPGISELIGPTKTVVIVGNKVDLLIQDGPQFLNQYKEALVWCLRQNKVDLKLVKHVTLISAKTGFGIESLISVLHNKWGNSGDVYLVGCTNVGKSSLFNTLIQSDYCRVRAVDIMQRATVSSWPGTTLNLLKFPIMKLPKWCLFAREKRLKAVIKEEKALMKYQFSTKNRLEQIPLQEHVGRTFSSNSKDDSSDPDASSNVIQKLKGLNPRDFEFAKSKWFYDTPGVINKDQIINFLTAAELLLTVPKKMVLPRNFKLEPGYSLFIGGLARLDYITGADLVWFTVFASMDLPITVTKLEDADFVYQNLLGTSLFRVPKGGKERLTKWPSLLSKKLEIVGKLPKIKADQEHIKRNSLLKPADVDVVLSSAGWIAVSVPTSYRCSVEAWTPQGKGIYVREIPIIKNGHQFRGKKIPGTPAFKCPLQEIEGYSLTGKPPF